MKNIKAIFINAHERTVTEIEILNTLHAIYETIGCDVIEIINLGGRHKGMEHQRTYIKI